VGGSIWVKVRDYERSFYAGTHMESARFFSKEIAVEVGGFDKHVVFYEESTLPQRIEKLGLRTDYRIDAKISHLEEAFQLRGWLLKKLYYGKTLRDYEKKYMAYSSDQANMTRRLRQLLRNRRFYDKPLWIGVMILKGLEYSFMTLGYFESGT